MTDHFKNADQTRLRQLNSQILQVERPLFVVSLIEHLIDNRQAQYGADRIAEYVNEAEHGDGLEYWHMVAGRDELLADFDLYMQHRNGDDTPDGDAGYCADS